MTAYLPGSAAPASAATRCPGCGGSHTTWVDAAGQDNFLCKTCGACWHPAAGRTERVNPVDCPGCGMGRICRAAGGLAY